MFKIEGYVWGFLVGDLMRGFRDFIVMRVGIEFWGILKFEYVEKEIFINEV